MSSKKKASSRTCCVASETSSQDASIHKYAAEAAEERKLTFRDSLPPSLNEVASSEHDNVVAKFEPGEIVLGPKLGQGEFSDVYEVESFTLRLSNDGELSEDESAKRSQMKKMEKYRMTNNARYALKHIKQNYLKVNGETNYIEAASDLCMEAEILSKLTHPNIIKIRGMTMSGSAGFADGPSGYFLVIDRLFETLDQRINRWHGSYKRRNSNRRTFKKRLSSIFPKSINAVTTLREKSQGEGIEVEVEEDGLMDECLSVALQLSAAMKYLHKHSIIFRDVKPANVGFDVRGDVKIFDFGLARVVPQGGKPYVDMYEMSGAGSPRYTAPECISGDEYNMKADVYTFGLVLWEMLTGEPPYLHVKSREQLFCHVVYDGGRPKIDKSWPSSIKNMLESSFDANVQKRPKMELFYDIIRKVLSSLRGGDDSGLSHAAINRRRTVESLRNINLKELRAERRHTSN
eukprot:CAMPEP_0183709326 /NCGR_PEP_ID=MMETSP0737-20130205/5388_1 /TAXON_ID=385413 /ORGANISM="Thalassiosira miniscula, Strain CCMP1093" /LENGTH=460 /DNA_ID=CAMNT_0025937399 /DNA_START=260 /DNA_END=1642 /DNA_ORIENTATION=+